MSRSFKGSVAQVIDLVTYGGIVDSTSYEITHGVSFSIGQEGLFFCKYFDTSRKGEDVFLMLNGMSGLVLYDPKSKSVQARDIYKEYGNIWQVLFAPIEQFSGRSSFQYGSNGFENQIENWLYDNFSLFSQADTIIEFTFENIQINGGNEVEFDVFVRSNQDGIKFAASDIFLKYTIEAFGNSVVENDKLTASKEEVIENQIYTLGLSDFDINIVRIEINSSFSPLDFYPISQIPKKFLHIVIDIENIVAIGTISFDEFLMSNESMFYDESTREYVPFSKIILSHPTNVLGGPIIMAFSGEDDANPHHISAGTGEILTILGMGFGGTKGKVKFRGENLVSGGVETSEDDIEVWTEDMIQVKVPSADSDFSGLTAVSGLFSVELPDGGAEVESDDFLFVDYSVYNFRTVGNLISLPVDLADTPQGDGNTDGILEFSLSTNMSGNAALRAIVNQSLCDWNEQTQIKWGLKPSFSPKTTFGHNDQVNLIYFGEESEFTGELNGLGAYAILSTPEDGRRITCNPSGLIQREVDIVFRKGENLINANVDITGGWHFTAIDFPSNPSTNQLDFYTNLLHELGHAHLLRHTLSEENIMDNPNVDAGGFTRVLSGFDAEGGTHIMERSQEVGNSMFCAGAVAVSQETYCSPTNIVWIEDEAFISYYFLDNSLVFSVLNVPSGTYDLSMRYSPIIGQKRAVYKVKNGLKNKNFIGTKNS